MYIPQFIHPLNGYDHFTVNGHLVHLQLKIIIKILLRIFLYMSSDMQMHAFL